MEWERFFSQSQSTAAPVNAPSSYDSNRNLNTNVNNVGVIGAGRHNAPNSAAHTGSVGSGRMGPNYSLGTQFAQGQGQGLGQGQAAVAAAVVAVAAAATERLAADDRNCQRSERLLCCHWDPHIGLHCDILDQPSQILKSI